jgi:N-acetylglucosamine-6-phosphate deacetylase
MLTALTGARILTPDRWIDDAVVLIEDGRIVAAGPDLAVPEGDALTDLAGATLVPGFIDLHVHGGGGRPLATGDAGELRAYARWAAERGVTGFLASVLAAAPEGAIPCLAAVAQAAGPIAGGARLLGAHLEGPFVSAARRGALPGAWLHPPHAGLLARYLDAARGHLRVLTLAPELEGADGILARAVEAGVIVAAGHTDATYDQARAAFQAGARHVTHAFNAMRPFHHRDPGPLAAALDSPGVTLELIADGVHVHPAAARLLVAAAGPDRIALVTDAVPPAGAEAGAYRLGEDEATLDAGRVTLADGTIAGGALTMDALVRRVVDDGVASLADAVGMATTVPARVLGLDGARGRIAPGYDADLVALDGELRPLLTVVGGEAVYSRPA